METRREFIDTEGFDWKEATELAVNKGSVLKHFRVPKQRKSNLNINIKVFLKDHVLNVFIHQ